MSSSPLSLSQPFRWPSWLSGSLLLRIGLAGLAVAFCYCFHWTLLRYLTSEFNLRLDRLAGISLIRTSSDTVMWRGALYYYGNACTFVDVWCGAIPLIWNLRRTIFSNLATIAILAVVLFFYNVFRLSVSDVLFADGVPWYWSHGLIAGFSYFGVWLWVRRRLNAEQ